MAAEKVGVFEVGGKKYRWNIIFEDNEGASAKPCNLLLGGSAIDLHRQIVCLVWRHLKY